MTEKVIVTFPTRGSAPPYDVNAGEIIPSAIRSVRAKVGVLPDEKGVRDFLRKKETIGPYATGLEVLVTGAFKGKHLQDVQKLITAHDFKP